jgi:hypothetical protein
MESVRWMLTLAVRAGVQRVVLNGSFISDIIEPNDVDCVLLLGSQTRENRSARRELRKGIPFLDIAAVRDKAFEEYVRGSLRLTAWVLPKA